MHDERKDGATWLTFNDRERPEDKWDCHGIRRIAKELWTDRQLGQYVVVLSAGPNAEHIDEVNDYINTLPRLVLVLTADECGLFPVEKLSHPRMIVWQQTPDDNPYPLANRFIGYPLPDRYVAGVNEGERPLDWCFMGQVTHSRREAAVRAMQRMDGGGLLYGTTGFSQGFEADAYCNVLRSSKIAVCPAGACTPDTFRVAEALESGCVPVVDAVGPAGQWGDGDYWSQVYGSGHLLPVIRNWDDLPDLVEHLLCDWELRSSIVSDWWRWYNEKLASDMRDDLAKLSAS